MNLKKGFTLIELLVVVAIIGVLATMVMAYLGGAKNKTSDAKILAQVGQMTSQGFLFSGANGGSTGLGYNYVTPAPYQASNPITGASANGTAISGTLFNAQTISLNSLYSLASTLPGSTYIYYGWNGADPNTTGKWFFAASTSTGAFCNDNKGSKVSWTGTSPTTLSNFTTAFPNATAAGGYSCN